MKEITDHMPGIVVSRLITHDEKTALGFVAVEVEGKLQYLTPMQERFCRYWVMQPDAPSRAAWQAGYGENCTTDSMRLKRCHSVQYQLRKQKKIASRYLELRKLADRGINLLPEE